MTNYNDGKWHGWNGGECPVHPESEVEGVYLDEDGKPDFRSPVRDDAAIFDWAWEYAFRLIAFRVVKEHKEPREFWAVQMSWWKNVELGKQWVECDQSQNGATLFREVQP